MACWLFRTDDFGASHLELRVQTDPLSGTLLQNENQMLVNREHAGTPCCSIYGIIGQIKRKEIQMKRNRVSVSRREGKLQFNSCYVPLDFSGKFRISRDETNRKQIA